MLVDNLLALNVAVIEGGFLLNCTRYFEFPGLGIELWWLGVDIDCIKDTDLGNKRLQVLRCQ